MKILSYILFFLILVLTSCKKDSSKKDINFEKRPLVANVYDYNNNLIAHYIYNEKNQLVKREFTDPVNNGSSDLVFYYENNLVSEIDYVDHTYPNFSHEKHYYYNSDHKIDRIETHQNGHIISTVYVDYTNQGQVESFHAQGNPPTTFFEYDSEGNVIKTVNNLTDPDTGQQFVQECLFTYDMMKKPNFGLDYLIGINLLPWRGTTSNWEQSLSKNNMTFENCANTEYTNEYDRNNNLIAITTKWVGIETETPMTIRIEYLPN